MKVKFGPAGIGGINESISNLEKYKSFGISACEIAFTYGTYIHKKEDAIKIGEAAKKLGISLSIHAQYWINLNSAEKEKVEKSKERILKCLEIGTWIGASRVVFHCGFYGKNTKEETYENIKLNLLEVIKKAKEKEYTPKISPEIIGKKNVFGDIYEIGKLVNETGCSFCIDFAHVLARYGDYNFLEVAKTFGKYKEWHIHFSGIEYGKNGEKKHIRTKEEEIKKLLDNLPRDKEITIINESPSPVEDSVLSLNIFEKCH
jgi:deoxyribonuclease-4